jgi:hypothetical protein
MLSARKPATAIKQHTIADAAAAAWRALAACQLWFLGLLARGVGVGSAGVSTLLHRVTDPADQNVEVRGPQPACRFSVRQALIGDPVRSPRWRTRH